MDPKSPDQVTNITYEQLLKNLEAGKNLRDALQEQGEEAMDLFFLDSEGDWIEALPSPKETVLCKLFRRFAPLIKPGSLTLKGFKLD
jgi:hypothetical protein